MDILCSLQSAKCQFKLLIVSLVGGKFDEFSTHLGC